LGVKQEKIEKIKKQYEKKQVKNKKDKKIAMSKKRLIKIHDKKMKKFENQISEFDVQDK
jgi:hypothetical protein